MKTKTELKPAAFWSYAHVDDNYSSGRLSSLCDRLSKEVQVQTGEPFPIFRDRNNIEWGENWDQRIEQSLGEVTFFLPVITPSYLKSDNCRKELERFVYRERELKRNDLILPIIFVQCIELQNAKSSNDPLIQSILDHQWMDWCEIRLEPFQSVKVDKGLESLAYGIVSAIKRVIGKKKVASRKETNRKIFSQAKLADETRETLTYRRQKRMLTTKLMAAYYLGKYPEDAIIVEGSDIVTHKDYIPETPKELSDLDRNLLWSEESPSFSTPVEMPDFVSLLKLLPESGRIYDGFCYRFIETDGTSFSFCPGRYFEYLNSCEYLGYELSSSIVTRPDLKEKLDFGGQDGIADVASVYLDNPDYLRIRNSSELFDFKTRLTAFGTATLTIIKRTKKAAQFVMNRRSQKLSETPSLLHVIPAGTFQSNFQDDRFHSQEFSFTENIIREFIEELLDDQQLRGNPQMVFSRNDMFSETGRAFRRIVYDSNNLDLLFLGTVIDPINLKPEILTVIIIHEAFLRLLCGGILNPSWETEGERLELYDLNEFSISSFLSDNFLVPTGKAHLILVLKHLDFIKDRLAQV